VATGDVRLSATIVDIDDSTGRATAIRRLSVNETEVKQLADSAAVSGQK
jgi:hypothetical protein